MCAPRISRLQCQMLTAFLLQLVFLILQESDLYEYNARNQITLWGPKGEIRDYAAKQWSGLVQSYYMPRWELFLKSLWQSLEEQRPFNETLFAEQVFKLVEEPFTLKQGAYPTWPQGDSIAISKELHRKYGPMLL